MIERRVRKAHKGITPALRGGGIYTERAERIYLSLQSGESFRRNLVLKILINPENPDLGLTVKSFPWNVSF